MVRAILEGRKTQTRRILKPGKFELPNGGSDGWVYATGYEGWGGLSKKEFGGLSSYPLPRCPYGVPGDRLWVRENWAARLDEDHKSPSQLNPAFRVSYWADPRTCNTGCGGAAGRKRPGIHMPRWASRITLEVTGVRVERLQDISEEDARAEGVDTFDDVLGDDGATPASARRVYARLWDHINGAGSWEANPWVWVISFRRVTP